MPDHFAALNQPRRPWLGTEAVKECFHRASALWHPDVAGSGDAVRFAEASVAYSVLRDPVSRLRHLLEIEAPERLARSPAIPPDLAELFMRLAEVRQALDAFHKKDAAAASALSRALLAGDRQALWSRAAALHAEMEAAHDAALALLQSLDAEWPGAADGLERLAALQQRFAYLSKWRVQLGESLFKLQS